MTGWVSVQLLYPPLAEILLSCCSPLSHSKLTREGEIRRRVSRARTSLGRSLLYAKFHTSVARTGSCCCRATHPFSPLSRERAGICESTSLPNPCLRESAVRAGHGTLASLFLLRCFSSLLKVSAFTLSLLPLFPFLPMGKRTRVRYSPSFAESAFREFLSLGQATTEQRRFLVDP